MVFEFRMWQDEFNNWEVQRKQVSKTIFGNEKVDWWHMGLYVQNSKSKLETLEAIKVWVERETKRLGLIKGMEDGTAYVYFSSTTIDKMIEEAKNEG